MRGTHTTIIGATALIGLACTEGRVPTSASRFEPVVRLSMHAVVGSSGHALRVVARYARAAAPTALIPLDSAIVALNAEDTQVSVQINVMPCLDDEGREQPKDVPASNVATTCVLHLAATLLNAKNVVIDSAALPPLAASPAAPVEAPAISLGVSLGKLALSPRAATINAIGYALDLTVTALDKQGEPMSRPALQFTSMDTVVATVDPVSGHVIAKAVGTARIVVASQEQRDTATVTVRQIAKTISLTDIPADLFTGDSTTIHADVRDSAGVSIPAATAGVLYSSSNSSVVQVDARSGALRAVGRGTAVIQANSGPASTTSTTAVKAGVVFSYCGSGGAPVWAGYQQGTTGPWVRADGGASGIFRFRISDVGAIQRVMALGTNGSLGYLTYTYYDTAAQLQGYAPQGSCASSAIVPMVYKKVSGTVTGVAASDWTNIWLAGRYVQVGPGSGSFVLDSVPDGAFNLVAVRNAFVWQSSSSVIVRRGIDPTDGSTLPALDFSGPEAFAPVTANVTVTGLSGRDGVVQSLLNASGWQNGVISDHPLVSGTAPYSFIPPSKTASGDMLLMYVWGYDMNGGSGVEEFFTPTAADHTVALGPPVATPTFSVLGATPDLRIGLNLPSQAEYGAWMTVAFTQRPNPSAPGPGDRYDTVYVSPAYFGGTPATWSIAPPAWSATSGYDVRWGLQASATTHWDIWVQGAGSIAWGQRADGATYLWAWRSGTVAAPGMSPSRVAPMSPAFSRTSTPPPLSLSRSACASGRRSPTAMPRCTPSLP